MTTRILALALMCASLTVSHGAEQWQPTGGPLGGDVRCMALDPDIPDRVYLGLGSHAGGSEDASGGGLFFSNDSGDHWNRSSLQNVKISGTCIAAGRIWVSTYGHGIFSATDPNGTWSEENNGLADLNVLSLHVSNSRLIIGTETGPLVRQVNNDQWITSDISIPLEFWHIDSARWQPQLLLAATDSSVWRSEDGGISWTYSGTGIDQYDLRSITIGRDGRCWAGSFNGDSNALVYTSADTGYTWTSCVAFPSYCAEGVWDILSRENEILVATGTATSGNGYVYRLVDGESEWEELVDEHYRAVRSLLEIPSANHRILAGFSSCGGVIGSDDLGSTWTPRLAGLDAGNVFSLNYIDPMAGTMAAGLGFSGTVAIAEDWGDTWTRVDSIYPSVFVRGFAVHPDDSQHRYEAAWNGLYRTLDGGLSWDEVGNYANGRAVEISLIDPDIIYAGLSQGLIISVDGGETWSEPDTLVGWSIRDISIDPYDANHAIVAGYLHVFETHDAGAEWDTLDVSGCRSITFHQTDPMWIYAGTTYGVSISQDGGMTFESYSVDSEYSDVNAIISDFENPSVIWAGTQRGVYKSIDGGQNWHFNSDGLVNLDVRAFLFSNARRQIFVGAHSGGVHWANVDATPVDNRPTASGLPRALQLSITPMPCRDRVSIAVEHACPRQSLDETVSLALYSLDGRRILEKIAPLNNGMTWQLSEVPAGLYAIRVSAFGRTAIQPISVLR